MGFRTFQTVDDRSRPVRVPYPLARFQFRSAAPSDPAWSLNATRRVLGLRHMEGSRSFLIGRWCVAVAMFARPAYGLVRWPGWQDEGLLLFGASVMLLAVALAPRVLRQEREKIERIAKTALPFCAACGYAMHGLTAQADGCTVCPECGAAWRVSR